MLLRILVIGAISAVNLAIAGEKPRDVNICDVMRLADELDGRLIRIRGLLRNSGTIDDPYFDELVPEHCGDEGGRQTVIHIVSPDEHLLSNPPRGYKPDMISIRRVEPLFRKAAKDQKPVSITVDGILQIFRGEELRSPRHRQYSASIVIQALRDAKER